MERGLRRGWQRGGDVGKHGDGGGLRGRKRSWWQQEERARAAGQKTEREGRPGDSRKDVGVAGGWKGTGQSNRAPGTRDKQSRRAREVKQGGEGSGVGERRAQKEKESWRKGEDPGAQDTGWEGTKLGREAPEKGDFSSPAPGKRRPSEGRAKFPAPRRPVVPRARRAPGGQKSFPAAVAMMRTAAMAASEQPLPRGPQLRTYRLRLCGPAAAEAAAAAGGRCSPGPPATAPAPAPAAGVVHWLPRPGTASPAANQRRAAPFGNFFPPVPGAARPRGGPRRAGGRRSGRLPLLGRVLAELGGCGLLSRHRGKLAWTCGPPQENMTPCP